jgi:hypothetical protein
MGGFKDARLKDGRWKMEGGRLKTGLWTVETVEDDGGWRVKINK